MISPNELRIGNWININGQYVNIGYGVIMDMHRKQKGIKNNYLDTLTFDPIPLTPEILEKCEFDRSKPILWIEKDYSINLDFYHENCQDTNGRDEVWVYYNNAKLCDVQYLHQLQNLFWCLCGEELTINI